MAKYGMSMCVLGMAQEFKDDGIAVNALWPKTGKLITSNLHYFNRFFEIPLKITSESQTLRSLTA